MTMPLEWKWINSQKNPGRKVMNGIVDQAGVVLKQQKGPGHSNTFFPSLSTNVYSRCQLHHLSFSYLEKVFLICFLHNFYMQEKNLEKKLPVITNQRSKRISVWKSWCPSFLDHKMTFWGDSLLKTNKLINQLTD